MQLNSSTGGKDSVLAARYTAVARILPLTHLLADINHLTLKHRHTYGSSGVQRTCTRQIYICRQKIEENIHNFVAMRESLVFYSAFISLIWLIPIFGGDL